MKILSVSAMAFPEVKVIRFARFADPRGYFTEVFRRSDFDHHADLSFLHGVAFVQTNESYSRPGTLRGLHFQWSPRLGKLVRTVAGRMIDLFADVRQGSPTFGQVHAHDMPARPDMPYNEWIWVPPGFAHGNIFTAETVIQYQCTGDYNPGCEAGISPLAPDLDWSRCDPALRQVFQEVVAAGPLISDKDRDGLSVAAWRGDARAAHFAYTAPAETSASS